MEQTTVTRDEWVARFRAIGLDDGAMERWHRLFERENPRGHQAFLLWLGLPSAEVERIRRASA